MSLSNSRRYMIPDALLRETATSDDVEKAATKVWAFLESNAGKVLVGKYWDDVSGLENAPRQVVSLDDVVEWDITRQLGRRSMPTRETWLLNVLEARRNWTPDEYDAQRNRWLELCERFADWLETNRPEEWRRLGDQRTLPNSVRDVRGLVEWAVRERSDLDTPAWRDALSVFPDRHAFARALRLLVWTVHYRAAGGSNRFENYWDDAQYAFLASYAGTLLTGDKNMARMTTDVFPSVRVLRDLPDVRW